LSQLKEISQPVAVEILPVAKANQPQTDSLPTFLAQYTSQKQIGTLTKEEVRGKMVNDWNNALGAAETKPQTSDISLAISALLAVKDEEELVRFLKSIEVIFIL
jgi:nucleosome binding factor SPN SPT16 subunit